MEFYYPGDSFPSLSVTGEECSLNCQHCKGRYLQDMEGMDGPDSLFSKAKQLEEDGGNGFLLSGGSDEEGKVPLDGYYGTLKKIKEETDLKINVHTGLPDEKMAKELAKAKIDVVSYDMIGSDDTIHTVIGSDKTKEDYREGYELLKEHGLRVVPHITVGLHGGELKGERKAVDYVSGCDTLVLNSLIPSEYGHPLSTEDFLSIVDHSIKNTEADIKIGCMRERGRTELEIGALKKGTSGIVLPAKETRDWANDRYDVKTIERCCAF